MKRLLAYLCVFVITAAIPAAADTLQQEILGIKWGTDISTLKHFEKLWDKGSVGFYLNPGAKHTIYDIQVPGVVYGFYSGKFFAAYIKIDDPAVFSRLKSELTAAYGDPKTTQTMKSEERILSWKKGLIRIKLKRHQQDGKMKLAFYYVPMSKAVNEMQQEEFQEKTWTLFPIEERKPLEHLKPEDLPSIPILRF